MTARYSGTCIGGPWAGRYYVSNSGPHIKVPILEPYTIVDGPVEMVAPVEMKTAYYHFINGFRNKDGRQMNFFVYEDHSTDCMDILETILDGYWKYMQACR